MRQIEAKILRNEKLAQGFYRMRIAAPYLAKDSKPGQFVEVRCSRGSDPLLRRPLGIHRIVKGGIELLYEVVGRGTELLSRMKEGEPLDVIGPLGNGFDITPRRETAILVAGGNGVAPLLALAEKLAYSVERIADREKIYVLIGGRTKSHILCEKEFAKLGCKVLISTDDGSKGQKGVVTDLLKKILYAKRYTLNAIIYACGPTGMLKAVSEIASVNRLPCQVSLEERMACGVGVCLGCPVKVSQLASSPVSRFKPANRQTGEPTNYTYKMVCKDGPVFNAEEIIW